LRKCTPAGISRGLCRLALLLISAPFAKGWPDSDLSGHHVLGSVFPAVGYRSDCSNQDQSALGHLVPSVHPGVTGHRLGTLVSPSVHFLGSSRAPIVGARARRCTCDRVNDPVVSHESRHLGDREA
jgi:hypothetical protein